jgi:hypothetical protein
MGSRLHINIYSRFVRITQGPDYSEKVAGLGANEQSVIVMVNCRRLSNTTMAM